jgi:hypothetical protein
MSLTYAISCLTKHHFMKKYLGSGGVAPRILELGTRWRWVVSFTPQPLYPQGKNPWYPLYRRLGGLQSRSISKIFQTDIYFMYCAKFLWDEPLFWVNVLSSISVPWNIKFTFDWQEPKSKSLTDFLYRNQVIRFHPKDFSSFGDRTCRQTDTHALPIVRSLCSSYSCSFP